MPLTCVTFADPNQRPSKRLALPKWIRVVLTVVIALTIVYFVGSFIGGKALRGPEASSNQLVSDLQQDNPEAAVPLFPGGQTSMPESSIANYFSIHSPQAQGSVKVLRGLRSTGTNGSDPQAVVIYGISNAGKTLYLKVILIQITTNRTAHWYVDAYQGWYSMPRLDFNIND